MKLDFIKMSLENLQSVYSNPVGKESIVVFDIDYCLYSNPIMKKMEKDLIKTDAKEKYNIEDFDKISRNYHNSKELFYKEFNMHPSEFHIIYENLKYESYLSPDPVLRNTISKINCRKFCFTNACEEKARKILKLIDLEDCFEAVFCADSVGDDFYLKPQRRAFEFFDNYFGVECKDKVHFFDDKHVNYNSALNHGWNAYLVEENLNSKLNELIESKTLPVNDN